MGSLQKKRIFDATGTIGSLSCEIALNQILAENGDMKLVGKLLSILNDYRSVLKDIQSVSERNKYYLLKLTREDAERRLSNLFNIPVRGVPVKNNIASHAMCCLAAYTRRISS